MKNLEEAIDQWLNKFVATKRKNLATYLTENLTKEEAEKHADNIYNLQIGEGEIALLKIMLLAATPQLVLLKDNVGDWAALYINGKCITQGHSIRKDDILEALQERSVIYYTDVECETEDNFPSELPSDLTQLPGYIG